MTGHTHRACTCKNPLPPSSSSPNPTETQAAHSTCTIGQPDSWLHHLGPHLGDTFLGKGSDPSSPAGKHQDLQAHTHPEQGRLQKSPLFPAVLKTVSGGWTQALAEAPDSTVALREGSQAEPALARPGQRERELRLGGVGVGVGGWRVSSRPVRCNGEGSVHHPWTPALEPTGGPGSRLARGRWRGAGGDTGLPLEAQRPGLLPSAATRVPISPWAAGFGDGGGLRAGAAQPKCFPSRAGVPEAPRHLPLRAGAATRPMRGGSGGPHPSLAPSSPGPSASRPSAPTHSISPPRSGWVGDAGRGRGPAGGGGRGALAD